MKRISITIDADLLQHLDRFMQDHGLSNRSEALRDLIRRQLVDASPAHEEVTAVMAMTFDHHRRKLADKLVHTAHAHRDRILATTHVHLDARNCLEMSAMRGPRDELERLANAFIGTKGVIHGGYVVTRPV